MVDVVDQATRSKMMANIRGHNTKPELVVRRTLHALGFRFRLHDRHLAGRPDIVLPKHRVAIFVHGCFWHRHPGCRFCTTPAIRQEFWEEKFASNVARDTRQVDSLIASGWRIATIWECALKRYNQDQWSSEVSDWIKNAPSARHLMVGARDSPIAAACARRKINADANEIALTDGHKCPNG